MSERLTRIYEVSAIIGRYLPSEDSKGKWRVYNVDACKSVDAEYADKEHAEAGARLAAACDIDALYDKVS